MLSVPLVQQESRTTASVSARGTIQLLLGRGCFLASGYIISVILARGLGPAGFGVYGVIMSLLVWLESVGSAGVPGATTKLIPEHHEQAVLVERSAQMLLVLLSCVLFALCWALAPTLTRMFNLPQGVTLFRLAIVDLPFSGLYFAYQGILNGHRRFGMLSTGMLVYSLTKSQRHPRPVYARPVGRWGAAGQHPGHHWCPGVFDEQSPFKARPAHLGADVDDATHRLADGSVSDSLPDHSEH